MIFPVKKNYLQCKRRQHNTQLFNEFKYKRKLFDREYRKAKRNFLHEEKVGISESETKNLSEFWSKLKNVGQSTNKKSIPNEVLLESGKVSHKQSDILKHWRDTISEIYNPCNTDEEHEPNQQNNTHDNADHSVNVDKLDEHITNEECRKAMYKAKNKKAVGIDCLPNEILKKNNCIA